MRDKTRLKGFISEIGENEFVVTDHKTGASKSVAHTDVRQIKGNNMSTGAKIAIGGECWNRAHIAYLMANRHEQRLANLLA